MAQKAIDMHQLKQVQRLHQDGVAIKEIVRRTGISRKTVKKYLRKLQAAAVPQGDEQLPSHKELSDQIYNNDQTVIGRRRFAALLTHFEQAKGELHKTGVTRQLLWMEYLENNPDGYRYSQYCYLFGKFLKNTDPAFHWEYRPGEFSQMDFAGKKLAYVDRSTGEVIECEVFVGVLPFSGLIFCTAVRSQQTADFAHCTNKMVSYTGGVTLTYLVDNLRTAVKRSDKNEPVFTELCYQLSDHYQTTFSSTRPREPTDKGMVENAVNIVYTNIYAPMRKQVFHSLEELNRHIRIHLDKLNDKPYKNSPESRRDIFTRLEQPVLKPLPPEPFRVRKGKQVTVQQNYAIELPDNGHYYTVPYTYVGCKVWVCACRPGNYLVGFTFFCPKYFFNSVKLMPSVSPVIFVLRSRINSTASNSFCSFFTVFLVSIINSCFACGTIYEIDARIVTMSFSNWSRFKCIISHTIVSSIPK